MVQCVVTASPQLLLLLLVSLSIKLLSHSAASAASCIDRPTKSGDRLIFPINKLTSSQLNCFQDSTRCKSTKFSICLMLEPQRVIDSGCKTIFTTGGDSPYAFGSYLLHLAARRFLLGISGQDSSSSEVKWDVEFEISQSELPVSVCATWEDRSGLNLYIDGMRAVIRQSGIKKQINRYFTNAAVPYQHTMEFCKGNAAVDANAAGVYDICVEEEIWDAEAIWARNITHTDLQCTQQNLIPNEFVVKRLSLSSSPERYRRDCFDNCGYFRPNPESTVDVKQVYAIHQDSTTHGECICIGKLSYLENIATVPCSAALPGSYHLYLTSQLYLPPFVSPYFNVSVYSPYSVNMYTGDSIMFKLNVFHASANAAPTPVTSVTNFAAHVEFGDGTVAHLKQMEFSHTYRNSGSKIVKIKITTEHGEAEVTQSISLRDKNTEETVNIDVCKLFCAQELDNSKQISCTAAIAGRLTKTAKVSLNGVVKHSFDVADYSTLIPVNLPVNEIGKYSVKLFIDNGRTNKSRETDIVIGDFSNPQIHSQLGEDVKIVVPNLELLKDKLSVISVPDGAQIGFTTNGNEISLKGSSLSSLGFQQMQLKVLYNLSNTLLYRRLMLQSCPSQVKIEPAKRSGLRDDDFPVAFRIRGVGRYELRLCDGLHQCEFLVIDGLNGERVIDRTFRYNKMGVFWLRFRAGNRVCTKEEKVMIGTQVPINDAVVQLEPLMSIKEQLTIKLFINQESRLAIGSESNVAKVQLGSNAEQSFNLVGNLSFFGPFILHYPVAAYGDFQLIVRLENDIGSITKIQPVRIGNEIKQVTTQVVQPVGTTNKSVQFVLNLEAGHPLTVEFNSQVFWHKLSPFNPHEHADGTTLKLWRPKQGVNFSMVPAAPVTFTITEATAAAASAEFELAGSVQTRNLGKSLVFSLFGFNFPLGANQVRVRLSNSFGTAQTVALCGTVFHSASTQSCRLESTFRDVDGRQLFLGQPLTLEKSAQLSVTAVVSAEGGCESLDWYYHWELLRVIDTQKSVTDPANLEPQYTQCTQTSASQFELKQHSLKYGTYQLCVFTSPNTLPFSSAGQSRKCQTIEVVRSNLACKFRGEVDRGVNFGEVLDIDFSQCRDPDDFAGNNSLAFVASCVSESHTGMFGSSDCCSDTHRSSDWHEVSFNANASSSSTASGIDFKFYDFQGTCFPNPSLMTFSESERVVYADPEALNNNDMMEMCICAKDSISRQAKGTMRVKVLVIRNIQDAQNTLNDLDVSNPSRALAVISIISGTLKESNDTDLVSEVKEAASSKVAEVSENLNDPNQAVTLGDTLASITDGGVTENTKLTSSSALSNTAAKLGTFKSATADQVSGATRGSASTVANIQPTRTAQQQTQAICKRNMRRLGFLNRPDYCDAATETEVLTEARRSSVMLDPLDSSSHVDSMPPLKSEICDVPDVESLDRRAFIYVTNCDQLREMQLYMMPEEITEKFDERDKARMDADEETRLKNKNIANKAMGALGACANTALTKGDKAEVTSRSISVKSVKAPSSLADDEDGVGSDSNDGGVNIPESLMGSGMGLAMQTYGTNPIRHGNLAMESPTVSITRNDASGNPVKTKNVTEPISVFLKRNSAKSNCILYPMVHDDKVGNCHCINLTSDDKVIGIYVRDLKNDTSLSDINFKVYLNNGSCPNPVEKNYTWVGQLPKSDDEVRANLSKSDLKKLDGAEGLLLQKEVKNTVILPAELTKHAGHYCVFVSVAAATVKFDESAKAMKPNMVYEYCSHVENPSYFDDESDTWRTDGVTVGGLSCRSLSHLKVTHLTSFASDFVVPPNTIDFSNVWAKFKSLNENAAVFSVIISLLILYIFLLIWGRYMDKKDILRWGATPLSDNLPTDSYMYQISVMTGYRKGSGTKSKVYFIISGDNGDTGIREMNDGERKGFPRGEVYNYVLSSESCLGQLTFLRIWHDNSGKGDNRSWYLDQIVVNDLQTGEKFFFLCNNWLAVEEGDGMIERILPVSGLADLIAFKQLFSSSVQRKLRNEHLWFSIFSRPTRSVFTRTQRISCCLSLLFLTMITNAMFFRADEGMKKTGVTIGPITFTLDQIFISLVSTLIVFPPSILIITFFKKCRAKAVGNKVVQEHQDLSTKSNKYTWRSVDRGSQLFNIASEDGTETGGWESNGAASMPKKTNALWNSLKSLARGQKKPRVSVDDPLQSKKKPFLFPHWCLYIAWILVFFSVFGSAFFVILYSMEWGKDRSNDWLITFVLSFVQNVVFVQPIKVLLLAAVISMIIKKPESDDEEAAFDEAMANDSSVKVMEKKEADIQQIVLQRRTAREDLCLPNQEKLAEIREMRLKELKMAAIIKEMFAYGIFVLVVFFISYQTRSMNSFKLGDVIRNTFTRPFDNAVPTYDKFFKYLNQTLIPKMYAGDFDNGQRATWRDKLAINDGSRNIIRVGVPRLRQFRVKDDTCKTHKDFVNVIRKPCRAAYGWMDDDTKPFEPYWEPMDDDKWKLVKDNKSFSSPFVYQSSLKLKGLPYMAKVNTYKGGGYVLNFPRSKPQVQQAIDEIFELNWLDTRTRAVFIEFTVYNAPSNLFASVIMVAEFLESGGSITYSEVKVFRLFSYVGSFGGIVLFMEIVFALFVLYFCIREGMQIKELKCSYFNGFWNILEFTTLSITTTAVVMYIFKKILASVAMDALKEAKSSDYVNFGSIATYDELYAYMVGIVVFISTVKFIKILRFNKRMGMLGATIKLAAKDLRSFMVMFGVYFMAFCHSAYLIFGRHLVSYGSFIGTWEALFSMALGSFNFHELHAVNGLLGPIFFFSFVCLVSFALLGIFLTIINDAFSVVKANASLQGNEYELVEFMTKRAKQMLGCSTMGSNDEDEEEEEENEESECESSRSDIGSNATPQASFSGSLSKLKF